MIFEPTLIFLLHVCLYMYEMGLFHLMIVQGIEANHQINIAWTSNNLVL